MADLRLPTRVPCKMTDQILFRLRLRLSTSTARLAWTGPPAPTRFARTGWDAFPSSLGPLALLALMVLLNASQSVKVINLSPSS